MSAFCKKDPASPRDIHNSVSLHFQLNRDFSIDNLVETSNNPLGSCFILSFFSSHPTSILFAFLGIGRIRVPSHSNTQNKRNARSSHIIYEHLCIESECEIPHSYEARASLANYLQIKGKLLLITTVTHIFRL